MRSSLAFIGALVLIGVAGGGDLLVPDAPGKDLIPENPIDGRRIARFGRGDGEYGRAFRPADGCGPLLFAPSCNAWNPGDGSGHPVFDIVRFGRYVGSAFDPMIVHAAPPTEPDDPRQSRPTTSGVRDGDGALHPERGYWSRPA